VKDIKAHYDFQRWLWQRDLKDPKNMRARPIQVEAPPFPLTPNVWKIDKELQSQKAIIDGVEYVGEDFFKKVSLTGVPHREFKKYWKRRLALADKASADFRELLGMREKKKEPPRPPSEVSEAARALANKRWKSPT